VIVTLFLIYKVVMYIISGRERKAAEVYSERVTEREDVGMWTLGQEDTTVFGYLPDADR